jgi:uncharacterized protein HemY
MSLTRERASQIIEIAIACVIAFVVILAIALLVASLLAIAAGMKR